MDTLSNDAINAAVRETCILATIRFRALGLKRTDKDASSKVAEDAGAVIGAARVVVSRLPGADEHHRAITKAQNETRKVLVALSMPFGNDESWRLLPNANWEKLLKAYAGTKHQFDAALAALKADASSIIARARHNLGTLNIDVPSEEELVSAYDIKSEFREVPEGNFRGMPDAVSVKLKRHVERNIAAAIENATMDTLSRFVGPLSHFVERMRKYDEREQYLAEGKDIGREGCFRDSIVTNIKELAEVAGSLNVTSDPRITLLASMAQAIAVEPETLREDGSARAGAVQKAETMLSNLNDWLS